MTLDCFEHKMWHHCIKMKFQKITNFLNITSDDKNSPRLVTKSWIEVYDQSEKSYSPKKEIRIKMLMLRSDLCDFSDAYIVVKEKIVDKKKHLLLMILMRPIIQQLMQLLLILQMIMRLVKKSWFLKTMLHLSIAFQKLMA